MERDDIIEYSLFNHHTPEEGKKKRKKIWLVFWVLLIVTIVEVGLGFKFSRVPEMKNFLFITFITLTLLKAYFIVMSYMHLGDEKISFKYTVLVPFIIFITYLIFIALYEGTYVHRMLSFFQ